MTNNSQQPWYKHFYAAAHHVPMRAWIWLIGIVLVIATSYYGFVWIQYKLVKQQINCYTDLYEGIGKGAPVTPDAQVAQVLSQLGKYNSCNRAVNPRIGTIEFVKKESERGKSSAP